MTRVKLSVEGMTCEGCAVAVERALATVDGVREAKASFPEGRASVVTAGPEVSFYLAYGRKPSGTTRDGWSGVGTEGSGAAGASCRLPRSRRRDRALLWTAAILAAAAWTFVYWSEWFL